MQTARGNDLLMQFLPFGANPGNALFFLGIVERLVGMDRRNLLVRVAAEHDVGPATSHVGGDGDHARTARLSHDLGFARMLLGVEHLVRQFFLVEQLGEDFGISIEVVPTNTGWPRLWQSRMSAMMAACFSSAVR